MWCRPTNSLSLVVTAAGPRGCEPGRSCDAPALRQAREARRPRPSGGCAMCPTLDGWRSGLGGAARTSSRSARCSWCGAVASAHSRGRLGGGGAPNSRPSLAEGGGVRGRPPQRRGHSRGPWLARRFLLPWPCPSGLPWPALRFLRAPVALCNSCHEREQHPRDGFARVWLRAGPWRRRAAGERRNVPRPRLVPHDGWRWARAPSQRCTAMSDARQRSQKITSRCHSKPNEPWMGTCATVFRLGMGEI